MSLRTRLILSFGLIILLCLGIAAISVSLVLQNYRDQLVMTRLDDLTRPVINQIRSLALGQTSIVNVWTSIQQEAQQNNIFILLVDDKGAVIRQASPDSSSQPISVPEGLPHGLSQQTEGIFTAQSGQKFVYAAFTLKAVRSETVILCQQRSSIAVIFTGVIRPFIFAAIIALAISLLLAFLMARSIYHPVQQLTRAAANIAHGHYDEKVPISGPPEIKGLAANFNSMAEKVKESQQQMRYFLADASHQLRSPLTSIQGFAQAILDGTASDEETRNKAAGIIVDESQRMIRQVNELLELSRMQSGQVKMSHEPVELKEIIQRCLEIFALRLDEKKITVRNLVEVLPNITGDADRLEDVFCNLLDNAIKNTPSHGEIQLTAQSSGHSITIDLSDNGPGIPPEQIPYVFNRFQQSGNSRTGFGLGLAIAREIVLAHQGKIEVFSIPGEGARFSVTLPVK